MGLGAMLRNLKIDITDTGSGSVSTSYIVTDGPGLLTSDNWGGERAYRGALQVPGAWRASLLIADVIGSIPWRAFRDVEGGRSEPIVPVPDLLEQPSPPDTRMTTWSSMALDLLHHGNAVAVYTARDERGVPIAAYPVPADQVGVRRATPDDAEYWRAGEVLYRIGNREYPSSSILHIKGPSRPGDLRGMGVLELHLSGGIKLARDLAKAAGDIGRAGVPTMVIKSQVPDLREDEAQRIKDRAVESQRTRGPMVLNSTLDVQPLGWNPSETQLLDARKFSLHELALIYGVDPTWLGASTVSQVYQNIEQQGLTLIRFSSLAGHLERFAQALSLALPPGEWVAPNLDAFLRGDPKLRYEVYEIGMRAGWLTVEDVRPLEDLPPLTPEQLARLDAATRPAGARSPLGAADGDGGDEGADGDEARSVGGDDEPAWRAADDLKRYWIAGPGRVKWSLSPKPLEALYERLRKYLTPEQARRTALSWFVEAMGRKPHPRDGILPGSKDGDQ